MARKPSPRPTGRPSSFSDELADKICEMLVDGMSMRQICLLPDMPNRNTVVRWFENHPSFEAKYARARQWQAHYMDDLVYDTADACTAETAQADKVKIGAYQWRAARLLPKVYGDRAGRSDDRDAEGGTTIIIKGGLPED